MAEKQNLDMNKTPDLILQFLALFNQIDKHFDRILWVDVYLPFNEKIKQIIKWNYPISWFVKTNRFQLKHFWEIRNQITHGLKLDGHTYVYPSKYAMSQLEMYSDSIKSPPKGVEVFGKKVFVCTKGDSLKRIINIMEQNNYSHVPVYDDSGKYLWILNESEVLTWLINNENLWGTSKLKVWNTPLITDPEYVKFVDEKFNIYQIDKLFSEKKQKKEKIGLILITKNWKQDEAITWIITAGDTALIDNHIEKENL